MITSPAALWTMISGQNAFLTVGLFYGGLGLLTRSPAVAGILLGVLSYKPQLWILVPVALVAGRHWKALAYTIGTAPGTVSDQSMGLRLRFLAPLLRDDTEASSPEIVNMMFRDVSIYMTTILAAARILGVAPDVAGALHIVGALAGIGMVWFAFRRYSHSNERTAVLAAGTLLLTPYLVNYDMLMLMPAVVAIFRRRMMSRIYPLRTSVLCRTLGDLQRWRAASTSIRCRCFRFSWWVFAYSGFCHLESDEPGDVAMLAFQRIVRVAAISRCLLSHRRTPSSDWLMTWCCPDTGTGRSGR